MARRCRHTRGRPIALILVSCAILGAFIFGLGLCSPSRNVHYLKLDLRNSLEIRPALAKGSAESFSSMMARLKPYAAINGTFYDPDYRPLGDIVIGGKLLKRGHYRNAIAIRPNGDISFPRVSQGRLSWKGYEAGIAAGPRLVHRGRIALDAVADGFTRKAMTISAYRSGVGVTKDKHLLLVTTKETMTLSQFARVMLDLGATEAMNLDGGGACSLYFDGRVVTEGALPMTNVLAVYRK